MSLRKSRPKPNLRRGKAKGSWFSICCCQGDCFGAGTTAVTAVMVIMAAAEVLCDTKASNKNKMKKLISRRRHCRFKVAYVRKCNNQLLTCRMPSTSAEKCAAAFFKNPPPPCPPPFPPPLFPLPPPLKRPLLPVNPPLLPVTVPLSPPKPLPMVL